MTNSMIANFPVLDVDDVGVIPKRVAIPPLLLLCQGWVVGAKREWGTGAYSATNSLM